MTGPEVKRELIVTASGQDRTVTVEGPLASEAPSPGAAMFRIVVDGVEHMVDARAVRPGTWSLVLDGRQYVIDLDRRRTGITATVGASEAVLTVEDALHRRLASAAGTRAVAKGETIRAPIAGKVVKVLVAASRQGLRHGRWRAGRPWAIDCRHAV